MAGEDRRQTPDLRDKLLASGKSFAFFQAIRLIRYYARKEGAKRGSDPVLESLRIRPKLSFAHPSTEIDEIEDLSEDKPFYRMTANFLGIYGESSPLPAFYTEDLIDEYREGESATRDFLDTLNYPVYLSFHDIWEKYRIPLKVTEEKDPRYYEILYSMMGLGVKGMRDEVKGAFHLLKYIGLFSQFPKSALGLRTLLADAVEEPGIEIIPCIPRKVSIPEEQRFYLGVSGNVLGEESYLGELIHDRTRKIRIKVSGLDTRNFKMLLPGTFKFKKIKSLAELYLLDPMVMDLELELSEGEVETARLGEMSWSTLGVDSWLFSGEYKQPVGAVFEI